MDTNIDHKLYIKKNSNKIFEKKYIRTNKKKKGQMRD